MVWLHGALAALCLVIAGWHLVNTVLRCSARRLEACYAAMALGMAGMFSPGGDPVPAPVWAIVFLGSGAWSVHQLLRHRRAAQPRREAVHVLAGSLAMLFMLAADRVVGGPSGAPGAHPAHAVGAPQLAGLASAVALVLAAYFVLHALSCADRLHAARLGRPVDKLPTPPVTGTAGVATLPRAPALVVLTATLPALAHLLATAAMAIMLVGMI